MLVGSYRHIFIVAVLCLILMPSCSSDKSKFVMEGNFRNMNQAEFYVFDTHKGTKDTIHVQRGRFRYERLMADTAVLTLMFPNFSTLPIFAYGGSSIKLKGDASHLKDTKVTGSDENDEMTEFRLDTNQLTPPEVKRVAADYIAEHPTSSVSMHMLHTYFIQGVEPDYREARRLCAIIHAAQPTNLQAALLNKQLEELNKGTKGTRLPIFAVLDTQRKLRTNKDLRKDVNIVCLYANWNSASLTLLREAQRLQRKYPKHVALMAICIDATARESKGLLKRDTIECPVICTGDMWQTELARKMGLLRMPSNVIADRYGKVLHQNIIEPNTLREEVSKLIPKKADEEKEKKK